RLRCFIGGVRGRPLAASQTRAVKSRAVVTMRFPSGLNEANRWSNAPLVIGHLTVRFPSGLGPVKDVSPVGFITAINAPVAASPTVAGPRTPVATILWPSGLKLA